VRIVVAEDLYLLRDGMVRLIEAYGHHVVATATTGPETLDALLTWRPDVSVVDVRMPPAQTDEGLRAALASSFLQFLYGHCTMHWEGIEFRSSYHWKFDEW